MKKLFFLTLIVTGVVVPHNTSCAESRKPQPQCSHLNFRQQKTLDKLIAENKPTDQQCRPIIRMGDDGKTPIEVQPDDANMSEIACMVTGFKQVFWSYKAFYENLPDEIKSLLKAKNIKYIHFENLGHNFILYTPEGKTNALLLAKVHITKQPKFYLTGHLLGYSDLDIQAFFLMSNIQHDYEIER